MQSPDQLDDLSPMPQMLRPNGALRMFDLSDRVAVVTGATGVLGSALAIGLARAGAKVGILGRRSGAAEATSAVIREFHGQSLYLSADVLDVAALQAAKRAILERWNRIDILVNCAGGNLADAIVNNERTFFNLSQGAMFCCYEYDQIIIAGPVFPHEVIGFSGGNKYLFPGVSGPEILNFFDWPGALVTYPMIIGNKYTPVRAVVNRAPATRSD